jgi:hypothetical protein
MLSLQCCLLLVQHQLASGTEQAAHRSLTRTMHLICGNSLLWHAESTHGRGPATTLLLDGSDWTMERSGTTQVVRVSFIAWHSLTHGLAAVCAVQLAVACASKPTPCHTPLHAAICLIARSMLPPTTIVVCINTKTSPASLCTCTDNFSLFTPSAAQCSLSADRRAHRFLPRCQVECGTTCCAPE